MRLSQVNFGHRFTYKGKVYKHDPMGRDGGGQVAVWNITDDKSERLNASVEVELEPVRGHNSLIFDDAPNISPELSQQIIDGFALPNESSIEPMTITDIDWDNLQ